MQTVWRHVHKFESQRFRIHLFLKVFADFVKIWPTFLQNVVNVGKIDTLYLHIRQVFAEQIQKMLVLFHFVSSLLAKLP